MFITRRQITVDIECERVRKDIAHVMRGCLGNIDPLPHRQLIVIDHTRIHYVSNRHRYDRVQAQTLHEKAVRNVNLGRGEILAIRIAVFEQGIGFHLNYGADIRLCRHGV